MALLTLVSKNPNILKSQFISLLPNFIHSRQKIWNVWKEIHLSFQETYKLSQWMIFTKTITTRQIIVGISLMRFYPNWIKHFFGVRHPRCVSQITKLFSRHLKSKHNYIIICINSGPKKCIHFLLINIFGINLNEISISG